MDLISICKDPNKKYFKRGDLAAKEKEEYIKKHGNEFVSKAFDRQGPSKLTESESDGNIIIVLNFLFISSLH